MIEADVEQLMQQYPRIYFACHTRHVRDERADVTLSSHQASILDHLDEVEPTNLSELAGHMGVTASTMSIAVSRLVDQGYVVRERDAQDRRRVLLTLSTDGLRVKSEKSVLDPQRCARVLARLPEDKRAVALRGLSLLADAALQEMHARAAGEDVTPWRDSGRKR
ncbi:MAG: MarR family winged helix-turn-helix transcriptional regulator [Acidobacteriota bacterium]|jgi:DNA-binding MarR family transcriptional regulator